MKVQGLKEWTLRQLQDELHRLLYQHVEQRDEFDDEWEEALGIEIRARKPKHNKMCEEYVDRGLDCGCPLEAIWPDLD